MRLHSALSSSQWRGSARRSRHRITPRRVAGGTVPAAPLGAGHAWEIGGLCHLREVQFRSGI